MWYDAFYISILSEESGFIKKQTESDLCWVIDPMDGSFNYIRGAGPYAVSLALCKNEKPLFGVIYDLKMGRMTWGGKAFGAFSDGNITILNSRTAKTTIFNDLTDQANKLTINGRDLYFGVSVPENEILRYFKFFKIFFSIMYSHKLSDYFSSAIRITRIKNVRYFKRFVFICWYFFWSLIDLGARC